MESYLDIKNIIKRFTNSTIIGPFSMSMSLGEIVALLGPSGSGKTTLLRIIAGLETPDEGEVWLCQKQLSQAKRNLVDPHQRNIGFVFQDLALWPHMTVEGNLDFVLSTAKLGNRERRERIIKTLQMVRAEPLLQRFPAHLSGGEQQRVALARALVLQPRLLLLDEPFSHMDTDLKEELIAEIHSLLSQRQITTLLITHDRQDAHALAHRIETIPQCAIS